MTVVPAEGSGELGELLHLPGDLQRGIDSLFRVQPGMRRASDGLEAIERHALSLRLQGAVEARLGDEHGPCAACLLGEQAA